MKKILTLLIVASISFVALSEVAISVDGKDVSKNQVLLLAFDVFSAKKDPNLSQREESEIIRNAFLDMEFWLIADAEARGRNIDLNPIRVDNKSMRGFWTRTKYKGISNESARRDAVAIFIAINIFNLNASALQTPSDFSNLRDQFIARFASDHKIKLADYSEWKLNRRNGAILYYGDYDAVENELDEDSNGFIKAIYYVHRYTVRYYFKLLRWYVEKAIGIVENFREKGNESAAVWASRILFWILPYIFHMLIYLGYLRMRHLRSRVVGILIKSFLLMVVSVIIFFFGMSPAMLFFVFVCVPLILLVAPGVYNTMTQKTVYKKNQYGVAAHEGYGYDENGELVSINEQDIAYDIEYTKAGDPGAESIHNQVKE